MKSNKLVIGKKYYFDSFQMEYGTLLSNNGKILIFKPIGDTEYSKKPDGTVGFDIECLNDLDCNDWIEVEE